MPEEFGYNPEPVFDDDLIPQSWEMDRFTGSTWSGVRDAGPYEDLVVEAQNLFREQETRSAHQRFIEAASVASLREVEAKKAFDAGMTEEGIQMSKLYSFEEVNRIRTETPKFYEKFVGHEPFAIAVGQDIESVSSIERFVDYWTDMAKSVRVGLANLEVAAWRHKEHMSGGLDRDELNRLDFLHHRGIEDREDIETVASGEARSDINPLNWFVYAAEQIPNFGGAALSAIVGGAIGNAPGAATGLVGFTTYLESGLMMDELIRAREDRGEAVDLEEIRNTSMFFGTINGLFEALGMKFISKSIPKSIRGKFAKLDMRGAFLEIMGKRSSAAIVGSVLKPYFASVVAEVGTEGFQEAMNAIAGEYDRNGFNDEGDFIRLVTSSDTWSRIGHAALRGGQVALVFGGGGTSLNAVARFNQSADGKARSKAIQDGNNRQIASQGGFEIIGMLNAYGLANKGKFDVSMAEYIDSVMPDGAKHVYIEAKTLLEIIHEVQDKVAAEEGTATADDRVPTMEKNKDGEEVEVPGKSSSPLLADLEAALGDMSIEGLEIESDTGNYVGITAANYTTKLAVHKDIAKRLLNKSKVNREHLTADEIVGLREVQKKHEEVSAELRAKHEVLMQDEGNVRGTFILPQLIEQNKRLGKANKGIKPYTDQEVEDMSQLAIRYLATVAQRFGITLEEANEQYGHSYVAAFSQLDAEGKPVPITSIEFGTPAAQETPAVDQDTTPIADAFDGSERDVKFHEDEFRLAEERLAQNYADIDAFEEQYKAGKMTKEEFEENKDDRLNAPHRIPKAKKEVERTRKNMERSRKAGADRLEREAQQGEPGSEQDLFQKEEMDAVVLERNEAGEILAPNGEVSNLTEFQARLTRTPTFIAWFGKSKIVDENGEPRVVYHGTAASEGFGEFNTDNELGAHFGTENQAVARADIAYISAVAKEGYVPEDFTEQTSGSIPLGRSGLKRLAAVFIRIENPIELNDAGDWNDLEKMEDRLEEDLPWQRHEVFPGHARRTDVPSETSERPFKLGEIKGLPGATTNLAGAVQRALIEKGYDGASYVNLGERDHDPITDELALSYIVFDGDQVASAMADQFDDQPVLFQLAEEGDETYPAKEWRNWKPEKTTTGTIMGAPDVVNNAKRPTAYIRKIVANIKGFVAEGRSGKHWYEESAAAVLKIVRGDLVEAERFIQLLAIYSPQANVDTNVVHAVRAYTKWKRGYPRPVDPDHPQPGEYSVGMTNLDKKAVELIFDNKKWDGRKTSSFYQNLMHFLVLTHSDQQLSVLDMTADEIAELRNPDIVTADMWIFRALEYGNDQAGDDAGKGKYSFSENLIRRITAEINETVKPGEEYWLPHQVQAALWASVRTRYNWVDKAKKINVVKQTNAESLEKGFATKNYKGDTVPPESGPRRPGHLAIWRKFGDKINGAEVKALLDSGGTDFGTIIDSKTQIITYETVPSASFNHPITKSQAPEGVEQEVWNLVRQLFTDEAGKIIIGENGNNELSEAIGIQVSWSGGGTGLFEEQVSPNISARQIPDVAKIKELGKGETQAQLRRDKADLFTRAVQYIFKQDGVPWMRPDVSIGKTDQAKYKVTHESGKTVNGGGAFDSIAEAEAFIEAEGSKKIRRITYGFASRGVVYRFNDDLTAQQEDFIKDVLVAEFGPDIGYTKLERDEIIIGNFPGKKDLPTFGDHDQFVQRVNDAMDAHTESLGIREAGTMWMEGNYLTHNWVKDPKGKAVLNGIKRAISKRSDLPERLDGWRKLYEASLDRYQGAALDRRVEEARAELDAARASEELDEGDEPLTLFQSDPIKPPRQVAIESAVLLAISNSKQGKGDKNYWLKRTEKTNKEGVVVVTYSGVLAASGIKTEELEWMEADQALIQLVEGKVNEGKKPSLGRDEVMAALASRVIVIENNTTDVPRGSASAPAFLDTGVMSPPYGPRTGTLQGPFQRQDQHDHNNFQVNESSLLGQVWEDDFSEDAKTKVDEDITVDQFMEQARKDVEARHKGRVISPVTDERIEGFVNVVATERRDKARRKAIKLAKVDFELKGLAVFRVNKYRPQDNIDYNHISIFKVTHEGMEDEWWVKNAFDPTMSGGLHGMTSALSFEDAVNMAEDIVAKDRKTGEYGTDDTAYFKDEDFTEPGGRDYRENKFVWENPPPGTSYKVPSQHKFRLRNIIAHTRTKIREFFIQKEGFKPAPEMKMEDFETKFLTYHTQYPIQVQKVFDYLDTLPGNPVADDLRDRIDRHIQDPALAGFYRDEQDRIVEDAEISTELLADFYDKAQDSIPGSMKVYGKPSAAVEQLGRIANLDEIAARDPKLAELVENYRNRLDHLNKTAAFLQYDGTGPAPDQLVILTIEGEIETRAEWHKRFKEDAIAAGVPEHIARISSIFYVTDIDSRAVQPMERDAVTEHIRRVSKEARNLMVSARGTLEAEIGSINQGDTEDVYSIEEGQSDLHHEGSTRGYKGDQPKTGKQLKALDDKIAALRTKLDGIVDDMVEKLATQIMKQKPGEIFKVGEREYRLRVHGVMREGNLSLENIDSIEDGIPKGTKLEIIDQLPRTVMIARLQAEHGTGFSLRDEVRGLVRDVVSPGGSYGVLGRIDVFPQRLDEVKELRKLQAKKKSLNKKSHDISPAPLRNNWVEMLMRMSLREAINGGQKAIAWTTSAIQLKRWDNQLEPVDKIEWVKHGTDTYALTIWRTSGDVNQEIVPEDNLSAWLGGNNASTVRQNDTGTFTRADQPGNTLEAPKTFLIELYDKEMVNYMNKLGKKYGAKVSKRTDIDGNEMWYFPIPEEMEADLREQGVTLFSEDDRVENIKGYWRAETREQAATPTADPSTFPHESAHGFLTDTLKMAEAGDQQAVKDINTVLNWLGLEDIGDLMFSTTDIDADGNDAVRKRKIKYHEQFADGNILYMGEGKAPSTALQAIFDRFRVWLMDAVKRLEGQGLELNDEMRSLYGSMLVSDAEILTAKDTLRAHEMTQDQLKMNDEQYARYQKYIAGAVDLARRRMDKATVRKANRRKGQAYRELKKKIKAEVTLEVESKRVNRARSIIMRVNGGRKLNKAEVKAELKGQKDERAILKATGQAVSKDGETAALMAEEVGYDSVYEMFRDMAFAKKKDVEIDEFVQLRMEQALDERDDIALVDDDSTSEAQDALHNSSWEKAIVAEIKALEALTGKSSAFPVDVLKANAKRLIAQTRVKDLKPNSYIHQERLASNRAFKAMQDGDEHTALEEKATQLLYQYMAREAFDKQRGADKNVKLLRRLNTTKGRAGIDSSFLPHMMGILDRFDLRQNAKDDEIVATVAETKGFIHTGDDSLVSQGAFVRIDEDDIIYTTKTPWHQLTVQELEALTRAMANLRTMGKNVKTVSLHGDGNSESLESKSEPILQNMKDNLKLTTAKPPDDSTVLRRLSRSLTTYWAELRKRRSKAYLIDGSETGGAAQGNLITPVDKAQGREEERSEREFEALRVLFKKYGLTASHLRQRKTFAGGRLTLTMEQVYAVALNWGNEANRDRITQTIGSYLTPDGQASEELATQTVKEIRTTLDDTAWTMVQEVWDYLNLLWPEIAALEYRTTGVIPERVEPTSFETATGKVMRGGYYPINYDSRVTVQSTEDDVRRMAAETLSGRAGSAMTAHGHTKIRLGSGGRIVKLELSTIFKHVGEVVHDLTHRETLNGVHRILKANQGEHVKRLGKEDFDEWTKWINRTANGDERATTAMEEWAGKLRGKVTIMGMGLNFSTASLQIMGLTNSAALVGTRWIAAGMGEYMAHRTNPKEWRESINARSSVMRGRAQTFNRDIREMQRQISAQRNLSWWESSMFMPIVAMQSVVDSITWVASYNKGIHEGASEQQAIDQADSDVVHTQGSGRISDLSGIEGGGPWQKLFTTFYSFFNTLFNLNVDLMNNIWRSDRNAAMKMVATTQSVFLLYILPATMTSYVLDILIGNEEPEDEKEWVEWALQENLNYFVGQFPFIREAVPNGYRVSGPAGLRFIQTIHNGILATGDLLPGGDEFGGKDAPDFLDDPLAILASSDAAAIMHGVGTFLPLPTTEMTRFARGVHRGVKGEAEGAFDLSTGLIFRKERE